MLISLYTSRVVLRVLGVEDLGTYTVIGGMVALFAFLDGGQSSTFQRYYNYAMGRPEVYNLSEVFSTSVNVQILIASVMFVVIEIAGLLLLYNYLVIPSERMNAAFWVFQFSAITLVVNTLSVPYNSMIIAKENMTAFAYIDISNVILKLLILFAVEVSSFDKLIFYAFLILCVQLLTRFFYTAYCNGKFIEAKYRFSLNRSLIKEMTSFSFWIVLSSIANILLTQGIAILYNAFWGVVANAAIGIGNQVRSAIVKLTSNLTLSFGPQMVINYANGQREKVNLLWTVGTKCALGLFAAFSIPVIIDADYILKIWLENPPQYTTIFLRLILIENLIRFFAANASTVIRATGKIKVFEITTNVMNAIAFLLITIGFYTFNNIELPFLILIFLSAVQVVYSLVVACRRINYSVSRFFISNSFISALALVIACGIGYVARPNIFSLSMLFVHVVSTVIIVLFSIYFLGLLPKERQYLNQTVMYLIKSRAGKV